MKKSGTLSIDQTSKKGKYRMSSQKNQDTFLAHILNQAETLKEAPRPLTPIPRQWLPGWIRFLLKALYLPVLVLDLSMQNLAKKIIKPPFKQVGSCKRRGNCCYFILLPECKGLVSKVYYLWQTQVNGFFLREKSPPNEEGEHMLVLGCRHLKKDGSCNSYRTRPAVCRRWPVIEHFGRPRLLKGCGYTMKLNKGYEKEPFITLAQANKTPPPLNQP
ncbi:MAG: hypothetical protein NTZ52_04025 [Chlamydiae bacterium]|nr:hypothetical protein [Chlamydiota bacterium]